MAEKTTGEQWLTDLMERKLTGTAGEKSLVAAISACAMFLDMAVDMAESLGRIADALERRHE